MISRKYVLWLWLLSGAPVGIALVLMPPMIRLWCFVAFIIVDTAHCLSPIILAWTNDRFRRDVIYANPRKYILWPAVLLLVCVVIGAATSEVHLPRQLASVGELNNPLLLLFFAYSMWNLYHFAMQDFGVLMLCTGTANRQIKRLSCLAGLLATYFVLGGINLFGLWQMKGLPHPAWLSLLVFGGVVSANHWIVDIGLSGYVAKHSVIFVVIVLLCGLVGFVFFVATPNGMSLRSIPVLISTRLGIGMVHFLYSRWVWKLSDPKVRVLIVKELST